MHHEDSERLTQPLREVAADWKSFTAKSSDPLIDKHLHESTIEVMAQQLRRHQIMVEAQEALPHESSSKRALGDATRAPLMGTPAEIAGLAPWPFRVA